MTVNYRFRVLPLLPHPALLPDRPYCYFYPRGAVSVSQPASREESRGAGVSHHTLSLSLPLSLPLVPKIAVSRDRLVLERGRTVLLLRTRGGGLWIDTNSRPRQANPGAGWINVLLFLGAPCFQGRPNDAMTSMRVSRRLEELSGFHLELLQYFLLKGRKPVH